MQIDAGFDLVEYCKKCNVEDIDIFLELMQEHFRILTEVNSTMNLTRIRSEQDFWNKHVADSLSIGMYFPEIATKELKVIDIGCGGGFPSLVIAAAYPNISLTSVDSTGKKINYVQDTADALDLENLTTIQARACELNRKPQHQYKYDIVTARAVATTMKLLVETDRMPATNGKMIFYKTPDQANEEIPELAKLEKKMKYEFKKTEVFELPNGDGNRCFMVGTKTKVRTKR